MGQRSDTTLCSLHFIYACVWTCSRSCQNFICNPCMVDLTSQFTLTYLGKRSPAAKDNLILQAARHGSVHSFFLPEKLCPVGEKFYAQTPFHRFGYLVSSPGKFHVQSRQNFPQQTAPCRFGYLVSSPGKLFVNSRGNLHAATSCHQPKPSDVYSFVSHAGLRIFSARKIQLPSTHSLNINHDG